MTMQVTAIGPNQAPSKINFAASLAVSFEEGDVYVEDGVAFDLADYGIPEGAVVINQNHDDGAPDSTWYGLVDTANKKLKIYTRADDTELSGDDELEIVEVALLVIAR